MNQPNDTTLVAAPHVLTADGWLSPGFVTVDRDGRIADIADSPGGRTDAEELAGFVIPGMPNLHSHAFQRAMAGLTERPSGRDDDSFWTWRETMYDFAQRITPDELQAIAAWLYVEMLRTGMTCVGEFHYLHHGADGVRYDDPAELTWSLVEAARQAGIGLTHLPVFYARGGIGRPIEPRQRRFAHDDPDEFLRLFESVFTGTRDRVDVEVGCALHSVRAVEANHITTIVDGVHAIQADAPIHIHIAEQRKEVEDCIAAYGAPPIRWLFDTVRVDETWCLVHATHTTDEELALLARSKAVAGLCPTTEANLGDGVFPLAAYRDLGGHLGIGTDSHVSVGFAEELRTLEYGQRLSHERRNVGGCLLRESLTGGAQALAQQVGQIAVGARADLVVLDPQHPRLIGHSTDTVVDAIVYSSAASNPIRDVFVAGRRVVADGHHVREAELFARFHAAMQRLRSNP